MGTVVISKKRILATVGFVMFLALALYLAWTRLSPKLKVQEPGESLPATNAVSGDWFTDFRLYREKVQKEQMDLIKKVMDDPKADQKARESAHSQYLSLVDAMGKEMKIEGILRGKGWESLAFLSGDSCTVVVRATRLDEKDAAQIGDVVRRIAKVPLQNVTIVPTP